MTEPSWTTNELDRIGNADELYVAPRGKDGALRRAVPIWAVRVGDELYVRSWRGNGGRWYRAARVSGEGHITAGGVSHDVALRDADDGVNDAVDAAFREKYGRYTGLRRADGRAAGARAGAATCAPLPGRRVSERRQRRGVVLAIILAGYLLVLIDVSILMAALPSIRADLGFSDTSLSWAQNAYTLTFGGLLLLGARAGDLLGRRRTFMLGIAVFTAASLSVGLAQSPAWMIAARAVQGIGAATLAPSTLALLSTSFPEGEQRSRAMAAYGALAGIGTAAGLLIGGALTQTLSWRYGFLLNVPIGLAAIVAAPRYLDESVQRAGRLDVPGALSSTFGAAALVLGIVHSADAGWGDHTTVLALTLGTLLIALFVTGLVNVAHHLGGALGLGILVTVFDAAGAAGDGPRELLADRVSAALTAAAAFLVLALLVTLMGRPRRAAATPSVDDVPPTADFTASDAGRPVRASA
ncbi:MFS transporter [Candidatus Solirubrobacter pratensis]|uniref:MFS transporter n=1 Tax=Candidatus Solirubrobacter pratensis TaxID=1298857 RepID=UPI00041746A4|nr:MFS transporter [Candidatus Solirubrobacter pratensis]